MDSDGPIRGRSVDRNRRRERVGRGPRKYAPAARQNKLHVLNPRELRRNCHLSAPAKISRVFWSGGGGWFWSAGSQGWLLVTKLMCNQSTLKFSERVRRVSQIRSGGGETTKEFSLSRHGGGPMDGRAVVLDWVSKWNIRVEDKLEKIPNPFHFYFD